MYKKIICAAKIGRLDYLAESWLYDIRQRSSYHCEYKKPGPKRDRRLCWTAYGERNLRDLLTDTLANGQYFIGLLTYASRYLYGNNYKYTGRFTLIYAAKPLTA